MLSDCGRLRRRRIERTNSARVSPFLQFDLRLDKRWVFESWVLSAYLDIQNLTSRSNAEGLEYNYDFSETQQSSGLPVLPIFGLKGEF